MGSWDHTNYGVRIVDKKGLDLLKQLIDCIGKEKDCWETDDWCYSAKDKKVDIIFENDLPLSRNKLYSLLNRLFGDAYLHYGIYSGNSTSDVFYEEEIEYDPKNKQLKWKTKDICYDYASFADGTPYALWKKELEVIAKSKGIKPSFIKRVIDEDEDEYGYTENQLIPNPENQEFCQLCDQYIEYDEDNGYASAKFDFEYGNVNIPKRDLQKIINLAKNKGYDELVEKLSALK